MPTRSERRKNRKYTRTPSGKVAVRYFKGKASKRECALCEGMLHGVPHGKRTAEVSKLSKTEKRPSVKFGGVLCSKCRTTVMEEAAKVSTGLKTIKDVGINIRQYVESVKI